MKVKIGDTFYDPDDQPIMIVLDDYDKKNIAKMPSNVHDYCCYPDSMSDEEVYKFMGLSYEGAPRFTTMEMGMGGGILKIVDRKDMSIEEVADLKGKHIYVDGEYVKVLSAELLMDAPGTISLIVEYLEDRSRKT